MLNKELKGVTATLLLAAAVLFALAFTAEAAEGPKDSMPGVELVTLADAGQGREYVYSPVTGVVYIENSFHKGYGIVEMSDPETGLPLTYERFCELAGIAPEA